MLMLGAQATRFHRAAKRKDCTWRKAHHTAAGDKMMMSGKSQTDDGKQDLGLLSSDIERVRPTHQSLTLTH
ncbi:hypothetical protein QM996_31665 (plasmid) [Sinorhizobium chiapasense]